MKTIKLIDHLKLSASIYAAEFEQYETLSDAELSMLLGNMSGTAIARAFGNMSGTAIDRAFGNMSSTAIARAFGNMSDAEIARAFGNMSGTAIARLNLEIPIVEELDKKVFQAVGSRGDCLKMQKWHSCETTHCRGGWHIALAGEAGFALEKALGGNSELAARWIYEASTGKPAPDFYASNEDALADIKARAEAAL